MRPNFSDLRQKLSILLEEATNDNTYLSLDAHKDYYTVVYEDGDSAVTEETRPTL